MDQTGFDAIFQEEVYSFSAPVTVMLGVPFKETKQEHRELLRKILHAVGLSLEAVRIVHQAHFDVSGWIEKPRQLIAFIPPPAGIARYEVIETSGMSVVVSDSIDVISGEEASKRKLWNALKLLFPA